MACGRVRTHADHGFATAARMRSARTRERVPAASRRRVLDVCDEDEMLLIFDYQNCRHYRSLSRPDFWLLRRGSSNVNVLP